MTDTPTPPPPAPQRWLGPGVLTLLGLQLALLWVQGVQLQRQHQDLVNLRADVQELTESLDHGAQPDYGEEANPYVPGRHRRHAPRLQRVRQEPKPADDLDPATQAAQKDLKEARESARKGVEDARKAQSQLSLSENARKAEEKAKVQEARATWEVWVLVAGILVLGAFLLRGWLRAREA